jgi:hypothetical protein
VPLAGNAARLGPSVTSDIEEDLRQTFIHSLPFTQGRVCFDSVATGRSGGSVKIPRYFTKEGESPYSRIRFAGRSSEIRNPDGSTVFKLENINVPEAWSQVAVDILAQKYFRKAGVPMLDEFGKPALDQDGNPKTGSETDARQVFHRLAGCWRHWGEKHGYFDTPADAQAFYDELCFTLAAQVAAPNSPQWFNTGLHHAYGITGVPQGHYFVDPTTHVLTEAKNAYEHPQPHACFIQSVKDDLVNDGGARLGCSNTVPAPAPISRPFAAKANRSRAAASPRDSCRF